MKTLSTRPAVLHLAPDMEIGHLARETIDIGVQTHRAGLRALLASAGGPWVVEAERAAVRHTTIPAAGGFWARWRGSKILQTLIDKERPVLMHVHGFEMIPLALRTMKKSPLPWLIDLTDPAPVTSGRRKLLHVAAAQGARFRVPSEFMARHLRDDFGLPAGLVHLTRPGVDLTLHEAARVTPERLHRLNKEWRLPEPATVVIMATPFAPGMGHKLLLETVTAQKQSDVYLVLISHDKYAPGTRAEIEKAIAAHGLGGKVITPEVCTDWPAACWLASLVVAANAAPRGQAPELLAAQALGRPVIVTDCGANAEMVKKDETAWIIPPDNAQALQAAFLEAVAMSPARRIDLAIQTRAFVTEHFPMEAWRDSLFDLYDDMVSPNKRPVEAAA